MKKFILASLIVAALTDAANADVFECETLRNFKGELISSPEQYSVDVKSGHNGDVEASLLVRVGSKTSVHPLIYSANSGDDNVLQGDGLEVHVAFEYHGTKTWTDVGIELMGTDYFAGCTSVSERKHL